MKKIHNTSGIWHKVISLLCCLCISQPAEAAGKADFLKQYFSPEGRTPVSYTAEKNAVGTTYSALNAAINDKAGEGCTLRTISYTDSKGIQVNIEARIYNDFEAVEWVAQLKNTGKNNSPTLEHINICNAVLPMESSCCTMHYAKGSDGKIDDFAPMEWSLKQGKMSLGTNLGRSSDTDNLPFFNLATADGGVVAGIGWTGNWRASAAPGANGMVELQAGFSDKMKFYLKPGEEVRTPSIVLMFWKGADRMVGHNLFRQLVLNHFTPQQNGQPMQCPITMPLGYNGPSPCVEFNCSNEWKCLSLIEFSNQMGLKPDLWWIDAGWYECPYNDWYVTVGSWTPDERRFPNGMTPIGKATKKHNQGFLIWFEPERVCKDSWLWNNKQEWLLHHEGANQALLNLGNKDAVKWISKHIIKYAKRDNMTWYRQDFNMRPVAYWDENDEQGRSGISEIRHIEGLYQFWDNLTAAGINVDNCASGGRRIDLESIRRSIPLWRTDYNYCEPVGYQSQTYALSLFLPCHTTGTSPNPVPYLYRSGMTNGGVTTWDINQRGFQTDAALKLLQQHREVRDFYYADFHPLTPYTTERNAWIAYQFHQLETAEGMALAFRREEAETTECHIRFQALDAQTRYELWNRDTDQRQVYTGNELMNNGLTLQLSECPSSALITYKKLNTSK